MFTRKLSSERSPPRRGNAYKTPQKDQVYLDFFVLFNQRKKTIKREALRQYADSVKHPSLNQAQKIEETLHQLAEQMKQVSVYPG